MQKNEKNPRMTFEQTAHLFQDLPLDILEDEILFNAHVAVKEDIAKQYPDNVINVNGEYIIPQRLLK